MTAHSTIVGGSTANIMLNCPGHRRLLPKAPAERPSEYAAEGTALHNAIELLCASHWDENIDTTYPSDYVGWRCPDTGVVLTEDHAYQKLGPAFDAFQEHVLAYKPTELLFEVQATFKPVEGSFGTVDVFALLPSGTVIVWDWKFGDGVMVSPYENTQLLYYAVAALFTPGLRKAFTGGKSVELWICQPSERNEETAQSWSTTLEHLFDYSRRLINAVHDSESPTAKLVVGDHCRWCKAKPVCPELKARAEGAVELDPNDMTDEELETALHLCGQIEAWARSVRAYAHNRAEDGKPVPGWKLVQKRATRVWADEEQAIKLLGEMKADEDKIFSPRVLRSPAQIEKIVGKSSFKDFDEMVQKQSSGTTLAPEGDKREAVVPANAFKRLAKQAEAQGHRS